MMFAVRPDGNASTRRTILNASAFVLSFIASEFMSLF